MKLTIIVADRVVGINGEFRKLTLPNMGTITAVQFMDGNGHVEYSDKANEVITDSAPYQPIIDAWNALTPLPPDAPTLNQLKALKIAEINTSRMVANTSYFTFYGKQIACDSLSRSDIDAIAGSVSLNGELPASFPNVWKCLDNTYIAIPTASVFKQLYNAMVDQGSANFIHSEQLKGAAMAATTADQLALIQW
jgi:hypothetical protein